MFKPTEQQQEIVEATDSCVPVIGYAGAAKTSTLEMKAQAFPHKRFQYIAFNKSMAEDAASRFPRSNTVCKTMHSLAYKHFGAQYQSARQLRNLGYRDISNATGEASWNAIGGIKSTIEAFLGSADFTMSRHHVPSSFSKVESSRIITAAQDVWSQMQDLGRQTPMTHDGYLKLWQLSKPNLNCDIVMLDEAQDANPIFMDIALHQHSLGKQLFIIGDPHQQIYRFRGASNAFNHPQLSDFKQRYLSKSFRFGNDLAKVATFLLATVKEKVPLQGNHERKTHIGANMLRIDSSTTPGTAIISRTVAGTLDAAIRLLQHHQSAAVHWVGGIENYNLQDILDVYHLSRQNFGMIENKRLVGDYPTFAQYTEVAEATQDPEMNKTLRLISNYEDKLPGLFADLRKSHNSGDATFYVCTAHRSKGLDFNTVIMNDDFSNPLEELKLAKVKTGKITQYDYARFEDEINLLYVGATRAKFACSYTPVIDDMKKELISSKKQINSNEASSSNNLSPKI